MADMLKLGEAGQLRVMSELILRGHCPYRPVVDDHGVDILLSNGLRIQVKTVKLHLRKQKKEAKYHMSLGWSQSGAAHKPIVRGKKYSEECDYFIIFGVDENRFWIVPSFIMDGRRCLELGPRTHWRSKEEVDALLASGVGVLAAAEQLGVNRKTVRNLRTKESTFGGFARAVRMCEDKWGFLVDKTIGESVVGVSEEKLVAVPKSF